MRTRKVFLFVFVGVLSFWGAIQAGGADLPQFLKRDQKASGIFANLREDLPVITEKKIEPPKEVKLFFAGDIMLARSVKTSVEKNFAGDYQVLFDNAKSYIASADIAFANLEGPISERGKNVGSKFSFRFVPDTARVLRDVGFDVLSFANNHAGDWSTTAFTDTLSHLQTAGILYTGAGATKQEASRPAIVEKNGIKVGYLAFSDVGPSWLEAKETSPGILLSSDPDFAGIITRAKTLSDILIVSIHWGEEYKNLSHTKRQEYLGRAAIDAGANIVVGHHPHVIEDTEYYKEGVIFYSLGNFVFDQYFSPETMQGAIAQVTVDKTRVLKVENYISKQNKNYQIESVIAAEDRQGYADEERVVAEAPKPPAKSSPCPKPAKEYIDVMSANVGQAISIYDTSYVPPDLTPLPASIVISGRNICLRKEAADKLTEMTTLAKTAGLSIKVSSGFRSFDTQGQILSHWLKLRGDQAYLRIAKPGYSEHQLGTAIDLSGGSVGYVSADTIFGTTPEAKWLEANAHLFGYVRSYPEGKESVTGYMYEPWHYRYVGPDAATAIKNSGQTVTEYLAEKEEFTSSAS